LKAGVPLDTILNATLADFEASLGLQDSKAAEEIKGFFPELTTDVTQPAPKSVQPSTKSTREPVSAVEFAQELVQKGSELVSDALGGEPANPIAQEFLALLKEKDAKIPQQAEDFYEMPMNLIDPLIEKHGKDFYKTNGKIDEAKIQALFDEINALNEPMFKASDGEFFNDGKGSLTEQVVGSVVDGVSNLISGETDGENPEVTQGSGTISPEDPLFKQDNILNKTARAKAIAENAEELQRNYERESIDPPDNIGAINETIVDLGEGFLKAVARSFEATGKAGAERTRELQRFARQAALYKELLNNPNVEAQELTKKIDLATSQNIGIGNVDNSKRMAELLELRDPDKALAAAQKFLSPEAKKRIDNASSLFGDASAADAALMLAKPYLSEEAKQRILTRFPVIKPQETQPPIDLLGRSNPTALSAAQEIDTTGTVKLGSSPTETATKVFQLKSVLEQNGKVPLLSATKDAVKGEKAKKLAIRSWKKAFGKHYRENGTAKPAFMKQALDIAKQTETDVTTVIKAVLGTNPPANKLFVTSGLTATEAQQLHKKYQEIRRLFEQMQGDNS